MPGRRSTHDSKRGLDRENEYAATMKKIVLGNTGRTTPTPPTPTLIQPNPNHTSRTTLLVATESPEAVSASSVRGTLN